MKSATQHVQALLIDSGGKGSKERIVYCPAGNSMGRGADGTVRAYGLLQTRHLRVMVRLHEIVARMATVSSA